MADQRISQLTKLAQGDVAANDVLAIVDVGASTTKKVEAKDLFQAGANLADSASIDLIKLNQASTTKLGTTALADDAVTAAKLGDDSSIAYDSVAPSTNNFEGRGYVNSTSKNLQVWDGSAFQQVVAPTTGIENLAVTTGKLAANAVTTAKVDAAGLAAAALATDSVITAKIQDLAVTENKIGTSAVTENKIGTSAVTENKIGTSAVTYAKIQNVSTTDKLLGRSTAGAGNVEEITCTAAGRALLDDADATAQRTTLGLGSIATQAASAVAITGGTINGITSLTSTTSALGNTTITGGTITGITDLTVADGGTGASNASNARANLGLAIGTDVQAQDAGLQSIAGLTTGVDQTIYTTASDTYAVASLTAYGRSLIDDADAATARATLGLGSLATQSATVTGTHSGTSSGTNTGDQTITLTGAVAGTGTGSFATTFSAGAVNSAAISSAAVTYAKIQNVSATDRLLGRTSAGAGSVEEITCTSAGRALLDDADAATQRATLGLGTLATQSATVTGTHSGTSSGSNTGDQTITLTGAITGTGTGSFATTITASAVTENAIATNAVTTGKILDDAITAAKLADDSTTIVQAGTPSGSGAFEGQLWFDTNTSVKYVWNGSAWIRQAALNVLNFSDTTPLNFAVVYPDNHTANITTTLDTQAANAVFVGPTSGANAAPTFRALTPADLPDATAISKGIVQPGTGLAVNAGVLNHSNSVTAGTYTKVTVDTQGHVSAGALLDAADVPNLDAAKIATGELPTARIADAAVTIDKLANYSTASIGTEFPEATFTGQLHLNSLDRSFYMWDGNVWVPIGISAGQIVLAGTFDASSPAGVGKVQSVTPEGAAAGFVVNNPLPAPTQSNNKHYFVVSEGGTITTGNAPVGVLTPPDLLLSVYSATLPQWIEIDVSAGAGAISATNVSFTPASEIASTNVQTAIQEVSTECRNADNITSGTLAVARGGTNVASYTKGDLLAASASTTLTKLPVGTNGQVLRANSATATGLEYGADFVGTVTTVTSSTAALTVATATTTPALTVRSATTSVDGIVQLSDSTSTTSSVLAATPTAVKSAYDLAALALPKAGGTVTGDITLGANIGIQFEGTTDDANEIRLIAADATVDRTITLPNVTGTVVTTGDSGTVTSTMIADGTIANADVNASAAIAGTKVSPDFGSQTVVTTGVFSHALGAVGTPSITFTGDLNTGIYSPGADQVAVATNGTGRLVIDANGTVTCTSAQPTDGSIRISNTTTRAPGNKYGIRFADSASETNAAIYAEQASSGNNASALVFGTNDGTGGGVLTSATERLRITSAGLVGIGTSSPSEKLDVFAGSLSVGSHYVATVNTDYKIRLRSVGAATNNNFTAEIGITGGGAQPAESSLTFATQTWNGSAYVVTEKMRVDPSGRVGIGTTSPSDKLETRGGAVVVGFSDNTTRTNKLFAGFGYETGGTLYGNVSIRSNYDNTNNSSTLNFHTASGAGADTERARIDSSGRLLVGTSTARSIGGASFWAQYTEGTNTYWGASVIISNTNDNFGPVIAFGKSRGTAVGSNTVVVNGDTLGDIRFCGADGSTLNSFGAQIKGEVDGTPGANDMPGRLVFSTTADGASATTERMRITSAGLVGIGTSSPGAQLQVAAPSAGRSYSSSVLDFSNIHLDGITANPVTSALTFSSGGGGGAAIAFSRGGSFQTEMSFWTCSTNVANSATQRMVIDSAGNVGIGTTSPQASLGFGTSIDTTPTDVSKIQLYNSGGAIYGFGVSTNQLNYRAGTAGDAHVWYSGFTERVRIDSSGRLLVGTSTSVSAGAWVNGATTQAAFGHQVAGVNWNEGSVGLFSYETAVNAAPQISFNKSNSNTLGTFGTALGANTDIGSIVFSGSDGTKFVPGALIAAEVDGTSGANDMPGRLVFSTTADGASSPTESFRVTSSGKLRFGGGGTNYNSSQIEVTADSTFAGATFYQPSAISYTAVFFRNLNGNVGSITTDGSATAYNTSSDYRLKENVTPITNGITRFQQLRPSQFNFIADPDKTFDGFLAHEAQAVVPECVIGEKDAVDEDGNPVYQGIDQSKLVPLLTAALQEAIAKIETLEARLTAAGIE